MITSQHNDQLEIQRIQMATTRPIEQIIINRLPCLRLCTFGITTTEKKTENLLILLEEKKSCHISKDVKTLHSS
jgi:hypothetical protein